MPPGLDQDDPATRLHSGRQRTFVPTRRLLARQIRTCSLTRSHRVIDEGEAGSQTSNANANPSGVILPAGRERPSTRSSIVSRERQSQLWPERFNRVADAP